MPLPVLDTYLKCKFRIRILFYDHCVMTTAIRIFYIGCYTLIFYFSITQEQRANYKLEVEDMLNADAASHYAPVWSITIHNATRLLEFFKSSFCDELLQPNSCLSVKSLVMFSCVSFKIKQSSSVYRVFICYDF